MRGFFAVAAAATAALVLSAPAAVAAPDRAACAAAASEPWCFFPAPADWVRAADDFLSCPSCQAYGRQGVEQGRWPDYHCEGRVQGIGYFYDLHVPPGG
jgi:hypothetical protein